MQLLLESDSKLLITWPCSKECDKNMCRPFHYFVIETSLWQRSRQSTSETSTFCLFPRLSASCELELEWWWWWRKHPCLIYMQISTHKLFSSSLDSPYPALAQTFELCGAPVWNWEAGLMGLDRWLPSELLLLQKCYFAAKLLLHIVSWTFCAKRTFVAVFIV